MKICIYITFALNMGFQGHNVFKKNRILCNTNKIPKRLFVTQKILRKNYQPLVFFVYMTDKKTGNRIMLMGMLKMCMKFGSYSKMSQSLEVSNAYVFVTNILCAKEVNK